MKFRILDEENSANTILKELKEKSKQDDWNPGLENLNSLLTEVSAEFDLPEEFVECYTAFNAQKYASVLNTVLNHLRSKLKYSNCSKEQAEAYGELRELIYEELDGHEVELL